MQILAVQFNIGATTSSPVMGLQAAVSAKESKIN